MSGVGASLEGGSEPVLSLDRFIEETTDPVVPAEVSWRPVVVRLRPGEFDRFAAFCRGNGTDLLDPYERQLAELAAVRLPGGGGVERRRFVEAQLDSCGESAACGNWVHLPWARRVVHLLEREAYYEVITDRNRDKITREEQRILASKRIGVIGLSVGGEAAFTVAQEHLCGEIVLADFDDLDLSNLNRLGAGCDELGLNKAVLSARRIARTDPYLRVTILPDGVTESNLDGFLSGLDLLIEECDALYLKFEIRRRAKERRLDIIFGGDERGFLSIEPYRLWRELAPFHGRIRSPQPAREAYPDAVAFMHALSEWLGGWDHISERSRGSLERIGSTLCGYPQLAGEARLAAGMLAHAARRLLLGDPLAPFIGHLDLEQLLPGAAADPPR